MSDEMRDVTRLENGKREVGGIIFEPSGPHYRPTYEYTVINDPLDREIVVRLEDVRVGLRQWYLYVDGQQQKQCGTMLASFGAAVDYINDKDEADDE